MALRSRAVLLDFFLIKLFQEPAAAQEFVSQHILTFARWLTTPPATLIRAVGLADVSGLGFSRALLNPQASQTNLFPSRLAQFSARGTDALDLNLFQEQVQRVAAEFSTTTPGGYRFVEALSQLSRSVGLMPPGYTAPVTASVEKPVPKFDVKAGLSTLIQEPSQRSSFDPTPTILNFLSPVGEILLEAPSEKNINTLAVSAFEFGVEQVASFSTKTKPRRTRDWALSPGSEQLVIEKTHFNLGRAEVQTLNPGFKDNIFFPVLAPTSRLAASLSPAPEYITPASLLKNKFVFGLESLSGVNSGALIQPDVRVRGRAMRALRALPPGAESIEDSSGCVAETQRESATYPNVQYPVVSRLVQDLVKQLSNRSALLAEQQHRALATRMDLAAPTPIVTQGPSLLENLHTNTLQFALRPAGLTQLRTQINRLQTHAEVFELVRTLLDELPALLDLPRTP